MSDNRSDKQKFIDFWSPSCGLEEAERAWEIKQAQEQAKAPIYMPDIQPYQNMVDGKMITSRSEHREFLKKYNLNEVGNETKHLFKEREHKKDPKLTETIARVVYEKYRY